MVGEKATEYPDVNPDTYGPDFYKEVRFIQWEKKEAAFYKYAALTGCLHVEEYKCIPIYHSP